MTTRRSDYRSLGVPTKLMTESMGNWKKDILSTILKHYGITDVLESYKIDLFLGVSLIAERYDLSRNQFPRDLHGNPHGFENLPGQALDISFDELLEFNRPSTVRLRHPKGTIFAKPRWASLLSRGLGSDLETSRSSSPDDFADYMFEQWLDRPAIERAPRNTTDQAAPSISSSVVFQSSQVIICTVCVEPIDGTAKVVGKITSGCQHEVEVCRSCLQQSIAADFQNKIWDHIQCPQCRLRLSADEVLQHGDLKTTSRYNDRLMEKWKDSAEHFQQCRHPSCDYGQQIDPEYSNFITCPKCKGKTCTSCDAVWHTGLSCEHNRMQLLEEETPMDKQARKAREAENKATMTYMDGATVRCPECKIPGIKFEGCDHMTCPTCDYQYCWRCGADYHRIRDEGNDIHEPACPYHTQNLPEAHRQDAFAMTIAQFYGDREDVVPDLWGNEDPFHNPFQ